MPVTVADAPPVALDPQLNVPSSTPTPQPVRTPTLPRPAGAKGRIAWRYVVPIATIHVLALSAFVPWAFSWTGLALCLIGTHCFGAGINIGYHRLLTHRSFDCPKWVERFYVFLAICCLEDNPATWVATHRLHHRDSDEQPDPHSPLVNFWWSHCGWLFVVNHDINNAGTYDRIARDILKDPWYMWLQRGFGSVYIYALHAMVFPLLGFITGWFWQGTLMGAVQLATSWFIWGVLVRTVFVWHITWSVNSLSHVWGYRTFNTREESRNNWFVASIAAGEGWHNNHHSDPTSASNWNRWWEFDISYVEIKVMEWFGLATNVKARRVHEHSHGE